MATDDFLRGLLMGRTMGTAKQILRNNNDKTGLEMFRVLSRECDSRSESRDLEEAALIMNPPQAKGLEDLTEKMTKWEAMIKRETAKHGPAGALQDRYLKVALLKMLPI